MKAGRFGLGRPEPGMQIQDRPVAAIKVGAGHIRPGDLTRPSSSSKAGGSKDQAELDRRGWVSYVFVLKEIELKLELLVQIANSHPA